MASIFDKLNLKEQRCIVVCNAPSSFEAELTKLSGIEIVRDAKQVNRIEFALAFVTRQVEVNSLAKILCSKADGDALLWFAYPKGSSKMYKCDFNRDTGWNAVRAAGFDTVRQVAIDVDWSALRFRREEFIKRGKA